jgi:hypothetical protein
MAESTAYGFLLINGKVPNTRQLASLLGGSERETKALLQELNEASVFSVTGQAMPEDIEELLPLDMPAGVILSRRMLRDKAKADKDRENGKGGGNPKLREPVNDGFNPPDKAQKIEARGVTPTGLPRHEVETSGPIAAREGQPGPARDAVVSLMVSARQAVRAS